ncbi:hypothetical protein NQ315_010987, partial [Exocentrus adspersus]
MSAFKEIIIDKWRNIRDAFSKSLKKRSGQAAAKKYLYHDQLQFVLKILEKDTTCSSLTEQLPCEDEHEEPQHDDVQNKGVENINQQHRDPAQVPPIQPTPLVAPKNKKRRLNPGLNPNTDEVDKAILQALQTPHQEERQPDEDEAFFLSLLPHVKRMTPDEKLQFRIDMLQLIQRNTQKFNHTGYAQSLSNYSETSAARYHHTYPSSSPSPALSSSSLDTIAQ